MKKLLGLLFVYASVFSSKAQLLLPQFEDVSKVETFATNNEESTPIFFNNGNGIYFNRTYFEGKGENQVAVQQDIWTAQRVKGKWNKPYRLFKRGVIDGINSLIGTTEDGNRLYLLNMTIEKDTSFRKIIYIDQTSRDVWSKPVEVTIPGLVFGEKFANFYMTHDEKIMLISLSKSEKNLKEDLFVTIKQEDEKWSEIIDLGPTINTTQFEVYPYISDNGKNLYFSSNGHGGYGASDIFVSHRLDDSWQKWTKPLNLGEPINSENYDATFYIANNTDIYFTSNRVSEFNNIYYAKTNGEFRYANSIQGVLLFQSKILANRKINVSDENGNLIEQVITDDKGFFKFKKLKNEDNFIVTIAAEDEDLFEGTKIYFVDAHGEKTKRYILTKDGMFVNSKDLKQETEIVGTFNYNSLPALKTGLIVFDENGFPLDTVYTDENGNFSYSFLKYDDHYSVKPLNMTEDEFVNVEMYITDFDGTKLMTITPGKLHIIEKKAEELTMKKGNSKMPAGIDEANLQGAEQQVANFNKSAGEVKTIFFDFSSTSLQASEKNKLSLPLSILQLDKNVKIKIVGHTDNVGSEEGNLIVGKKRAKAIKTYFLNKGVDNNRITIVSKGESEPVSTNESEAGRAKNRRVELILE